MKNYSVNGDVLGLNLIKLNQPIGDLFVGAIQSDILLKYSTVNRRIEEDFELSGLQREIKSSKLKELNNYLSWSDATFPNSIIVNIPREYILSQSEDYLSIKLVEGKNKATFSILDGQHRLESFRGGKVKFDLIVSIFIGLSEEKQANIFTVINSTQTKVDTSLSLSLALSSSIYTPTKMIVKIAQSFQYDETSPWYRQIKLWSGKDGILSLSAFCNPLLEFTYPQSEYYSIIEDINNHGVDWLKDHFTIDQEKYIFWEYFVSQKENVIYKILLNFFEAMKTILKEDWVNSASLLCKTTGYNAMMKLFLFLYKKGYKEGKLTKDFFIQNLNPLKTMAGKITTAEFGASGQQASNKLYEKFMEKIQNPSNLFDSEMNNSALFD